MDVVCDIEANGLDPSEIWTIVCREVETNDVHVFHPFRGDEERDSFKDYGKKIKRWVGHNFLCYDLQACNRLLGTTINWEDCVDTLVIHRLLNSTMDGHSLADIGEGYGIQKPHQDIEDWSVYKPEMTERCIADTLINSTYYKDVLKYVDSPVWKSAIRTESYLHYLTYYLTKNGFPFDTTKGILLKKTIEEELSIINNNLKEEFLLKVIFTKEVIPKETKFGTINRTSIPRRLGSDLSAFTVGAPFSVIEYQEFNPGSHKQRLDRLWDAGWRPKNKTKGHREAEKTLRASKRFSRRGSTGQANQATLRASLGEYGVSGYGRYGWVTDDDNLGTLPPSAPKSAKSLVRYMLLSNRISTLNSWLEVVQNGKIHGSFQGIGAWTQRMAHSKPNMGNVPAFNAKQPEKTPYSDQMRSLWYSGLDKYLVGVDAESIQLRILAHYINDERFTFSLVSGKKEDGTDPHSMNQKALSLQICKSRDAAKTFIYAWILGATPPKVADILDCSVKEADTACGNFLEYYPGIKTLKETIIPEDASKGYFQGLDGRYVRILGEDEGTRRHLALAGYLQNGEKIIMSRAVEIWYPKLEKEGIPFWWVNFVHDEYQTLTERNLEVATYVAQTQADAIRQVGVDLGLRCPLAGSINNSHGKLAIGDTWQQTH